MFHRRARLDGRRDELAGRGAAAWALPRYGRGVLLRGSEIVIPAPAQRRACWPSATTGLYAGRAGLAAAVGVATRAQCRTRRWGGAKPAAAATPALGRHSTRW